MASRSALLRAGPFLLNKNHWNWRLRWNLRTISTTSGRRGGEVDPTKLKWNRDYLPNAYPNTPELRAAAAKRYNLRLEDYEPYPDDGIGHGDYPMLAEVGAEFKDPYEVYDDPRERWNYGEPLRLDFDLIREEYHNPNFRKMYPWSRWDGLFALLSFIGVFIGGYLVLSPINVGPEAMPKQFPYSWGEPTVERLYHYTFEPADKTD